MTEKQFASIPKSALPFTGGTKLDEPVVGRTGGLWWRSSGSGTPLVLIQGLGYPAAMFHRIVPLLEPHYRVTVFDQRGIGNSAKANSLDSLTIGRMASDVAAVIDDAAGGHADVLGVSLGGIVAQELAIASPQKVDRLILACTHTADSRVVVAEEEVLELMRSRAQLSDDEEALRNSVPYVYAPRTSDKLIEEDISVRREMHRGWDGYTAQLRASIQYAGTSGRLSRITAETLVLHGKLDRLVPPGNAEVIAERIPNAQLHLMPGVSHNFYSEAPRAAAKDILKFLDSPRAEEAAQAA